MKSPRGNARAAYLSRGISLPPRGSTGERVMFEMYKREQWNKLAEWEITMLTVAKFLGVSGQGVPQIISHMKGELSARLTHEYYDARAVLDQLYGKLNSLQQNKNMIDRLDSMSA